VHVGVLVGRAEAAQVGDHDVDVRQCRRNLPVLGTVSWPPMEQHRGRTGSGPLVREAKAVDGD
jgi:hypothetical protein